MIQAPLRALETLRPQVPLVVFVASAVSTVVFVATPFLITGLSEEQGVPLSRVGLISSAQLLGFVIGSWGSGRVFRPRRRLLVFAVLLGLVANIASGFVLFGPLVGLRFLNGLALGTIAWLAWAEVFGDDARTGDIAVIGPIIGTVASPVVGVFLDRFGTDSLFIALGCLHLLPLCFVHTSRLTSAQRIRPERHRPSPTALVAMLALGCFTLGGSAVFVFSNSIGRGEVGLSALAVSLVYSCNSIAGIPSSRFRGERQHPGRWILAISVCAIVLGAVHHPLAFAIAVTAWGFCFWMAVPACFSVLAAHSHYPAERAGDAQAYMAAGRVIGPLIGGALFAVHPQLLGIVGATIMAVSAAIFGVLAHQSRRQLNVAVAP